MIKLLSETKRTAKPAVLFCIYDGKADEISFNSPNILFTARFETVHSFPGA